VGKRKEICGEMEGVANGERTAKTECESEGMWRREKR
jgi:hypothetical protein